MFSLFTSAVSFVIIVLEIVVAFICYGISAFGYYLLYKKYRYSNPTEAWIPFYNQAQFLQRELCLPEIVKWAMTVLGFGSFVPFIGIVFAGLSSLLVICLSCLYISKHSNNIVEYIVALVFSPILPYFWLNDGWNNGNIID